MNTIKEFSSYVEENILSYLPEEFAGATVSVAENLKTNGIVLYGLSIRKEGQNQAPLLYLEQAYSEFCEEEDLEAVMEKIAEAYLDYLARMPKIDFDKDIIKGIPGKVKVKLVSAAANPVLLKEAVSRTVAGGFALIAYIDLSKDTMATLKKELLSDTEYSEEDILNIGLQNTVEAHPAMLADMQVAMFANFRGGFKESDNLLTGPAPVQVPPMMVLSNQKIFLGACTLFYPGLMQEITAVVGGSYYILPSSIHELLIVPEDGRMDPDRLLKIVKDVNSSTVDPTEQLGNKVLFYDATLKELIVAAGEAEAIAC